MELQPELACLFHEEEFLERLLERIPFGGFLFEGTFDSKIAAKPVGGSSHLLAFPKSLRRVSALLNSRSQRFGMLSVSARRLQKTRKVSKSQMGFLKRISSLLACPEI